MTSGVSTGLSGSITNGTSGTSSSEKAGTSVTSPDALTKVILLNKMHVIIYLILIRVPHAEIRDYAHQMTVIGEKNIRVLLFYVHI